jgi:hypothetical protein
MNKKIIGRTAKVYMSEISSIYLAEVNTSDEISSINAFNIKIKGEKYLCTDNIGRVITFQTTNENGVSSEHITEIKAACEDNAGGGPMYSVEMVVSWSGITKRTIVNLTDKIKIDYKMTLGRNWLSHDCIVDIDLNEDLIGESD